MKTLFLLGLVYLATADHDSSEEYPKPMKGKKMKKFNKMGGDNFFSMGPMGMAMGPMPMGPFGFGPMGMGMGMPDFFTGPKPNGPEGEFNPFPMRFRGKFKPMNSKRGPFPGPLPDFLKNISDDARKQISQVMSDMSITIEEKDSMIEEILKNEPIEAQEAFTKFKTEMAARRAEMERKLTELREKLSPAAKEADQALSKIMKDTTLTPVQRREQIREMFETLPMEIKMELREMRRGMGNKITNKIREVGDFIGDVRASIKDAIRSAFGQRGDSEIRRAPPPMRRLKFVSPEPSTQLETKPIAISDDEKFLEF